MTTGGGGDSALQTQIYKLMFLGARDFTAQDFVDPGRVVLANSRQVWVVRQEKDSSCMLRLCREASPNDPHPCNNE